MEEKQDRIREEAALKPSFAPTVVWVVGIWVVILGLVIFSQWSHVSSSSEKNKVVPQTTPAVVSPVPQIYSLEEKQEDFKAWSEKCKKLVLKTDKAWENFDKILASNLTLAEKYNFLNDVQSYFGLIEESYSLLSPPTKLSADHQKILRDATEQFRMSMFYSNKIIKLSKEYLETGGKPSIGSQIIDYKKKIAPLQESAGENILKVKQELKLN
ncbi:MAG: hypothetical protein AB9895_00150 [Negativicutes bacterium]